MHLAGGAAYPWRKARVRKPEWQPGTRTRVYGMSRATTHPPHHKFACQAADAREKWTKVAGHAAGGVPSRYGRNHAAVPMPGPRQGRAGTEGLRNTDIVGGNRRFQRVSRIRVA